MYNALSDDTIEETLVGIIIPLSEHVQCHLLNKYR